MVVAAEVKEAVDDQRLDLAPAADAEFLGHLFCSGQADDDVPEVGEGTLFCTRRKAEHICRHVFSAMIAVEFSHAAIIDISQRDPLCFRGETIPQVM